MERTLVLIKPDGVQRGLIGRVIQRFEDKGLRVIGLKMRRFPEALIREHYAVHEERAFYESLVRFMTSGPAVAIALEGKGAIAVTRTLMGDTHGAEAAPGTIRGDFGLSVSYNIVHGSDGKETARDELKRFFPQAEELVDWIPCGEAWVYDREDGS